jgi:sugar/nucleoside kinase (ribokinase family)/ADP-ribosylglycohydrolase
VDPDRLRGGWLGRAVGCLLGKPVEKIPREGIREILEATGRWPLAGYFTAVGLPSEVAARWPWNRRSAVNSLAENIDGMPEDDDLNFALLALRVLETYGRDFSSLDVAQAWLDWLPGGRVFTAERVAYRNLLLGLTPPATASRRNPFREWIGAQIRTDVYGWVNPGRPDRAAELAYRDATVSHVRAGVYGALWVAAMTSAAVVASDVDTVLDVGESVLPPQSRFAAAVREARALGATGADWETVLDTLHARHGHLHWVHVRNNAALVAAALAYGKGDFERSICAVGETVLGDGFSTVPGGKGANQAVAAARAGGSCAFVGAVGDDDFGGRLRDNLVAAGVDVRGLRTEPGPSGMALIAVDAAAENLIVVAPGANGRLTSLDADDRAAVAAADMLLCQLEVPLSAVTQAAEWARDAGTTTLLNAAPAAPLPAALLDLVDLLVVNEHEAAVVAGRSPGSGRGGDPDGERPSGPAGKDPASPDELLDALLTRVPRVVMTLGARGARYADRAGLRLAVEAPRIEAVDTTAAGDAFTGALAVAWAERGRPTEPAAVTAALRWACAAGAACAERPGASTALPTRAEIEKRYAASYASRGVTASGRGGGS